VNIVKKDDIAPFILENRTKVQQLDSGKYQVSVIIEDNLSFIEYGKVSI
jgi:hypothetical protein